jgi:hypothetical protein
VKGQLPLSSFRHRLVGAENISVTVVKGQFGTSPQILIEVIPINPKRESQFTISWNIN